jgi:uncharacterized protein (DUF3820 family)
MPKDAWQTARNNDIARRASRKRPKRAKLRTHKSPEQTALKFNRNTRLWFGKYKDKQIHSIPRNYLFWLARSSQPSKSWRIDALVIFLRRFLALPQKGKT